MKSQLRSTTLLLTLVTLFVSLSNCAHAQSNINDLIPDFSPEEQQGLAKNFGLFTSAVSIFTGLNTISAGSFKFDGAPGERDTSLNTYRIPYTYTFGEDKDTLRPYLSIIAGHFEMRSTNSDYSNVLKENPSEFPDFINALPNNPDFVKTDASSLSAGFGFGYHPTEALAITPGMDFIWTHIKRRYDYNNFLSALLGQKYDRDLFNTSVEAIAYAPSIKVAYKFGDDSCFSFTPSTQFTYLSSYDLWSKSRFASFSSDATVLFTSLDFKVPTDWTAFGTPVAFNPFFNRTDLGLAAQDGTGLWYFHDVGANFTFDLKEKKAFLKSLRLGASYSFGDSFSGYRIGAGVEL